MTQHNDLYQTVTDRILAALRQGIMPWRSSWKDNALARLPLRKNNIPYSGINTVFLLASAGEKGYTSPYWMTFRQAKELKGHVRKGEKSTPVFYADTFVKEEHGEDGSVLKHKIPFMKQYRVFNADQIDGLPELFTDPPPPVPLDPEHRNTVLERFFRETKVRVVTGEKARYNWTHDTIEIPPFQDFNTAGDYYGTLAHEITHWTGHPKRLCRTFNQSAPHEKNLALEDLVAELGGCLLAAELGFTPLKHPNRKVLIASWIKAMENDSRFIFRAASHAQKAVEYLRDILPAEILQDAATPREQKTARHSANTTQQPPQNKPQSPPQPKPHKDSPKM